MLANVVRVIQREGLPGAWRRIVDRVHFYTTPVRREWDDEFNVETATPVLISKLAVKSRNTRFACHYEPIGADRFHKMMRRLDVDHSQFTFVDVGSGKGKGLLLAAAYPFKECIGVEFSRELDAIAQKNFASYRGPVLCPLRSVVKDATEFTFPDSPMVVYFYNPFEAAVIGPVLHNLKRSKADPLYVLYYYPPSRFAEFPEERGTFDAAFTSLLETEGCTLYRR